MGQIRRRVAAVARRATTRAPTTAQAKGDGLTYKPALDGLRAVAVMSVIAYHFGADWMPGGFLGVDTFFVLSGYLITTLLLTEWGRNGTIRLSAFWARRARRLLPALMIVLAAVGIWAYFKADVFRLSSIRNDGLWTLFYGANWRFVGSGQSYFDTLSEPSPFRHAWSLAIEEQFYLLWPLITFACLRVGRGKPRLLAAVAIVGSAVSIFLLAHLHVPEDPSRSYYGTDTRASQLLIGALLAIVLVRWWPRTAAERVGTQALGALGAAAMVIAFAGAHDRDLWLYHGGLPLFGVATAAVIAASIQTTASPLGSLLSLRPVRWIGQISYGLYLWHWPVVVALSPARTGMSGWELALLRLAVTFGAATLSYYIVELPIRHGHRLKSWRARLAAPIGFAVIAGVLVATTAGAQPPAKYFNANQAEVLGSAAGATSRTLAAGLEHVPTRWVLLGDSVANSMAKELQAEAARQGLSVGAYTRPGCGLFTVETLTDAGERLSFQKSCVSQSSAYERHAIQASSAQVVLWLSAWEMGHHLVGGRIVKFESAASDALLDSQLEAALTRFRAAGATHLVLLTFPQIADEAEIPIPNYSNGVTRPPRLNAAYRRLAGRHPDIVRLADLAAIVCPDDQGCPASVDGVRPRPHDGGHFSHEGAKWLAPKLIAEIVRALESTTSPIARERG